MSALSPSDEDLHPAQFVIGPATSSTPAGWSLTPLGDGLQLRAHPRLQVTRVEEDGRFLVGCGYCLDPRQPAATDEEILTRLLRESRTFEQLARRTDSLGGRWVLIFHDGQAATLFHDATGRRQVIYGRADGNVWCGSEPYFLAALAGLEVSADAASFIASPEFVGMAGGRWWPGAGTPFEPLRRLLPNHALRLADASAFRFWPAQSLAPLSLDDGARQAGALIRGQLEAAARRFDLTLMITGGRDSRVCFAAAKNVRDRLEYVTIGSPDDRDVRLAAQLLGQSAQKHRVVSARGLPTAAFWQRYCATSPLANRTYAADAEALLPVLERRRVAITGNAAEIIKTYYQRRLSDPGHPTPEQWASVTGLAGNRYAVRAFGEWEESARAADLHGVDLCDLFYWEQRAGSWNAGWVLEFDLVWRDTLAPFSCREALTAMLAVPDSHRRPPFELHRHLMRVLWPDVLNVPLGDDPRRGLRARVGSAWNALRSRLGSTA